MPRATLGAILGLSIGIADVLLMLPLSFPDKRTALLAAFCSRFSLGFFASITGLQEVPRPALMTCSAGAHHLSALEWVRATVPTAGDDSRHHGGALSGTCTVNGLPKWEDPHPGALGARAGYRRSKR
jgi:hypothetical protein